jgi:hypothetical protein
VESAQQGRTGGAGAKGGARSLEKKAAAVSSGRGGQRSHSLAALGLSYLYEAVARVDRTPSQRVNRRRRGQCPAQGQVVQSDGAASCPPGRARQAAQPSSGGQTALDNEVVQPQSRATVLTVRLFWGRQ